MTGPSSKLLAARILWALTLLACVAAYLAVVPVRYRHFASPEEEVRTGLARLGFSQQYIDQYGTEASARDALGQMGISPEGYALLSLSVELATALVYFTVALILAWRRSDDLFVLFVSAFLLLFGLGGNSYVLTSLVVNGPAGFLLGSSITALAYILMPAFFFLFPDGRLVPRWGWLLVCLWAFTTFFWNFAPRSPLNPTNWPLWLYTLTLLLIWGSALGAQIQRYRRISTPVQRQQTKWLVAGFGWILILLFGPILFFWIFVPDYSNEGVFGLMTQLQVVVLGFLPITLGIGILRYRLWNIDILIRKTLVYTLLTGLLALVYFASVVLLQTILGPLLGSDQSALITVLTTLGIAALFSPLRARIQVFIDRRFFRSKYNAELTLTRLAATMRDEVDLDRLSSAILTAAVETMQPKNASLCLADSSPRR